MTGLTAKKLVLVSFVINTLFLCLVLIWLNFEKNTEKIKREKGQALVVIGGWKTITHSQMCTVWSFYFMDW